MIRIRKSNERGNSNLGWLNSYHTFSFADYYDPAHVNFGNLRVINEDTVEAGYGFGKHPHNNMEIISYVVKGSLAHKDSMGTGSVIQPGEVQRMSAGTGVEHSEYNASNNDLLHFLQIWIIPENNGLDPSYEQIVIDRKPNTLVLIGSHDGRQHSLTIHQQVDLFAAYLHQGAKIHHDIKPGQACWVQLVKGSITLNGELLKAGDGAALTDEKQMTIESLDEAELLLFDMKK